MNIRIKILIIFILLLAGLIVYALFREPIYALSWVNYDYLKNYSLDIEYSRNPFLYFVKYCLSDMLWYSALLLSQTLFLTNKNLGTIIIFYVAASTPFVLELLQYMKIIPGTFDIIDICVYAFTLLIFILCLKKQLLS